MKIDYIFMIFGIGGTGGNFAKEFCRYLANYKKDNISVKVVFIDGDVIENSNLERQPFQINDINEKKATLLSEAVGDTFGFDVTSYTEYIVNIEQIDKIFNSLRTNYSIPVLIGAVDNHRCRQVLHEYYDKSQTIIYFDSANEFSVGEVVFGSKFKGKEVSPPRSFYYPDILTDTSPSKIEESCQQVNVSTPQHLITNLFAANILLTACVKLLSNNDISQGIVYFDSFSYMCVHREISGDSK